MHRGRKKELEHAARFDPGACVVADAGVREILLEIARVSAGDRSDEADVTVADTLKNVELDPCYPKYHDLRA